MKKVIAVICIALTAMSASAQATNFTAQKGGIKLTGVENPKTFLDAKLTLDNSLFEGKDLLDTGKTNFKFKVDNYTLGAQTPDAAQKLCANSTKGQHIHFILDNQPYIASYSPEVSSSLKAGHHVLLAFLSRSYHESIKSKSAFIIKDFDAGKKGVDQFDSKAPHIFYSRPKGEYVGKEETQKVLLDFYLVNCELSDKGYKVRATINGNQFTLTKWEAYYMEGLPLGENKVKLELLDKNDKLVISPFNGTERTFTLKEEPAAK